MRNTNTPSTPNPEEGPTGIPVGQRELVVIARTDAGLRVSGSEVASVANAETAPLAGFLADVGVTLTPLFGYSEERVRASVAAVEAVAPSAGVPLPDLSVFYYADAPQDRLDEVAERLRGLDVIEAAFVKPAPEPAVLNVMPPSPNPAPPTSPDFSARQGYLLAAPGGVDAVYARTVSGGKGANVNIIDVEGAWRFTHEDLLQNQGGVVAGTPSTDIGWRNHGTAVAGEISGDLNTIGITGIAPDARISTVSIFGTGMGSARAITEAANRLRAGDVMLIELHAPGPRFNFQNRADQRGYIAMEWWPDNFAAIQFATRRGIVVVEAGGNGAENLDDPIYNTPAAGFPATWTNPFRRGAADSGAVVVGAGAPPSGSFGPDRSRLDFSNYGALMDAQGWGREVVTTGYGDLQGGTNEDLWYTSQFSGTSSASPIVVGVLCCVQGMLRAAGRAPMTPAEARANLRATGSPQQASPAAPLTQRIGNRPNLRALHDRLLGKTSKEINKEIIKEVKEVVKDLKDGKDGRKDIKDKEKEVAKDTKDLKDSKEKEKEKELAKERIKDIKEKDIKEIKEKDRKELKEKDVFEGGLGGGLGQNPTMVPGDGGAGYDVVSDLDARITQIETAVLQLSHFISGDLRPDLLASALRGETPDDTQNQG